MLYKYNESRRHHFKKPTYRQSNYVEYNQSLRERGRIDIWLSGDIIENWQTEQRTYAQDGGVALTFCSSLCIIVYYCGTLYYHSLALLPLMFRCIAACKAVTHSWYP